MGKIGIITKNRDFYKQIIQILPRNLKMSTIQIENDGYLGINVAITDGNIPAIFNEGIPVFVIADKLPDGIRESVIVRFYKKGTLNTEYFLEDLNEWISITDALEEGIKQDTRHKKEESKLLDTIEEYMQDTKMASILQKKAIKPKNIKDFNISYFYQPVAPISGDIIFVKDIGSKIFIIVGDVTDHGYLAGLYATSLYSLIAGYLETTSYWGLSIHNLVSYLQHAGMIYQTHDESDYILNQRTTATLIICEIDKESQIARFINCGHGNEPPIVAYDKNHIQLIPFKPEEILPPIGEGTIKTPPLPTEIPFAEGSMLIFYTDGITEIFRDSNEKTIVNEYSKDRLLASVKQELTKENWTTESVLNGICKDAKSYCLSSDLKDTLSNNGLIDGATDDITIFIVKWEDIND